MCPAGTYDSWQVRALNCCPRPWSEHFRWHRTDLAGACVQGSAPPEQPLRIQCWERVKGDVGKKLTIYHES